MTNKTPPDFFFFHVPTGTIFAISGQKSISVLSVLCILMKYLMFFQYNLLEFSINSIQKHIFLPNQKCHSSHMPDLPSFFNHNLKLITASNQL